MIKSKTVIFLILMTFLAVLDSQAQKRYFNSRNEPQSEFDSCGHYEITYLDSIDSNKKTVEIYTCDDKLLKIIPFYYNQIDGTLISYDSLGILIKEENYLNGSRNGFSKKYWNNGKLRRQELFIDDKITSGKCFDETGKEVKYLAADREMKLVNKYKDLLDYLVKNLKYPIEDVSNGVTGQVVISYYVNEIGKVENINITTSVSPTIDAEAIRLIKQLPIESPNFVDDVPVRVQYWTPIMFNQ